MIFSTFMVIIFSILFGMYLGFRWAKGEDLYGDMSILVFKVKKFLKKIIDN
ncbi:MAG: hypothetical protein PWQ67_1157 [Clostridia bacterium]|nr:hypothetical protein [Clostridia bacterium]MDN5322703.1 hypothetical protein [Clostridia bacterium]